MSRDELCARLLACERPSLGTRQAIVRLVRDQQERIDHLEGQVEQLTTDLEVERGSARERGFQLHKRISNRRAS